MSRAMLFSEKPNDPSVVAGLNLGARFQRYDLNRLSDTAADRRVRRLHGCFGRKPVTADAVTDDTVFRVARKMYSEAPRNDKPSKVVLLRDGGAESYERDAGDAPLTAADPVVLPEGVEPVVLSSRLPGSTPDAGAPPRNEAGAGGDAARFFPFEKVRQLIVDDRPRAALDIVFKTFDDLLHAGNFDACGAILDGVVLDDLDPMVALGFLTITKAAAKYIPTRAAFVERVRPWLRDKIGEQRADHLLRTRG